MTGMSVRTSPWPAGVPCWVDLEAPDVAAAGRFYAAVLGWDVAEPDEQYGGYVIASRGGAPAAGIGPRQRPDVPAAWTLYLATDDADATQVMAAGLGGTVLVPAFDVGELGRMAVLADPAGAVFSVWQAGAHIGASLVNEPGGLTWEDLRSTDPESARAFYAGTFGWTTERLEMAGPDYTTFSRPDEQAPLGGIGGMMGAEGRPSHWLAYFGVDDAAAACAAATAAGGSVLQQDFETPFGRMAGLADPAGAVFWVIETAGSTQPDRSG